MKFRDLAVNTLFYAPCENLPYTKIEPELQQRPCIHCGGPSELNAKAYDGAKCHFCPDDKVAMERFKVVG